MLQLLTILFFMLAPLTSTALSIKKDCQILLIQRSANAKFEEWSRLPTTLSSLGKATIQVNLGLAGAAPTLSNAMKLSEPGPGLLILDDLRRVLESNISFVAHGERESLQALYQRIANSPAAGFASFRVVDHSSTWRPLKWPRSIPFGDSSRSVSEVDAEIKQAMTEGNDFSVYNLSEEQLAIFLPRSFIRENFDADSLTLQKIAIRSVARQPTSIARWLESKSVDFDKKTIVHLNEWSVVSASAFNILYKLNYLHHLPKVDEAFRDVLNECYGISCVLPPLSNSHETVPQDAQVTEPVGAAPATESTPAEESNAMNLAGRTRVIGFLKAHRAESHPLTEPYGVRHAFIEIAKLVPNAKAARQYKDELRALGFTASEYNLLYASAVAQERFGRAWRAFLNAMNNPYADQPFTTRNVQRAINLLPD